MSLCAFLHNDANWLILVYKHLQIYPPVNILSTKVAEFAQSLIANLKTAEDWEHVVAFIPWALWRIMRFQADLFLFFEENIALQP